MIVEDVVSYLQTGGIGTAGTDLFSGILPDSPDACVSVHEYAGYPADITMGAAAGSIEIERPSVQVMVRSARSKNSATYYSDARSKMHSVYKLLENCGPVTISSTEYLRFVSVQNPFFLERDQNDRVTFVCNFDVMKRRHA